MADLDPVIANTLLAWLTFFGTCIGSFLNVVVYRLPLGKSLSDPPSHCPKCGHPIRWYDNVPVAGWLWLGGRCRDCREPISVRYPIVEAVGGAVFGVIAWLTLRRGGDASLAEFFFFVLGLSSLVLTFFAAGLIQRDGKPVPWRLFLPVIVMTPMMPWLVQEGLHVVAFGKIIPDPRATVFPVEPKLLFGITFWFCLPTAFVLSWFRELDRLVAWLTAGVLLGFYLGWEGVFVIFVAGVMQILFRLVRLGKFVPPMFVLAAVTLIFIGLMLYHAPPFPIASGPILPIPD